MNTPKSWRSTSRVSAYITFVSLALCSLFTSTDLYSQSYTCIKPWNTEKVTAKDLHMKKWYTMQDLEYALAVSMKKKWSTLVLEWWNMHQLYLDSLTLYNTFTAADSKWDMVVKKLRSITNTATQNCLTIKQERELYDFFRKYIIGEYQWERKSQTRRGLVKEEKYGSIVLYYTPLQNSLPWIIAYHPTIKPHRLNFYWDATDERDGNCYDSAELYTMSFPKPSWKLISISSAELQKLGVTSSYQSTFFGNVYTLSKQKRIPKPVVPAPAPSSTEGSPLSILTEQAEIPWSITTISEQTHLISIEIPQSEVIDNQITISDYGIADNDSIQVEGKDYILQKDDITVDLTTTGNVVVIQITSEGTKPPSTLTIKYWTKTQSFQWKVGDIILIKIIQ